MMKRYLRKLSIIHYPLFISAALLVACSEDITTQAVMMEEGMPINIASTYPVASNTRATIDNGFVQGDAVGVFVVDYDKNGNPGELALKGNRGNNVKFTYDGAKWTGWGDKPKAYAATLPLPEYRRTRQRPCADPSGQNTREALSPALCRLPPARRSCCASSRHRCSAA